jgi:hypothetical protein
MDQDRPEEGAASPAGISARWAVLDPMLRRRIVWSITLAIILLIVVVVFAFGFAGGCRHCG